MPQEKYKFKNTEKINLKLLIRWKIKQKNMIEIIRKINQVFHAIFFCNIEKWS